MVALLVFSVEGFQNVLVNILNLLGVSVGKSKLVFEFMDLCISKTMCCLILGILYSNNIYGYNLFCWNLGLPKFKFTIVGLLFFYFKTGIENYRQIKSSKLSVAFGSDVVKNQVFKAMFCFEGRSGLPLTAKTNFEMLVV